MKKQTNKYTNIIITKKIILLKLLLASLVFFFTIHFSFAESTNCESKEGYSLYLCRIKNTCHKYDSYSGLRVYNTEKQERSYQESHNLFIAKEIYRKNMNNIYKCAMLKSQNNAYYIILNELNINNPSLGLFKKRIIGQQERLEEKIQALDCLNTEKSSFNLKKDILDESTLEMCKYLHFLDYVEQEHISDLGKMIKDKEISREVEEVLEQNLEAGIEAYSKLSKAPDYNFQQNQYTLGQIIKLQSQAQQELTEEINHTKRVYEVAFQTYANYETNMIIHLLLDLLKNDFLQIRNKIYSMLGPINQVAYKIPNASSK